MLRSTPKAIPAEYKAKDRQAEADAWNKGFSSGAFATVGAPSWMIGYIKGQAGDKVNEERVWKMLDARGKEIAIGTEKNPTPA